MIRLWVAGVLVSAGISAVLCYADTPLDRSLKIIEARYNRTQSLKLMFSETYTGIRQPLLIDSGTLFLRKPGMMRWEYASGKLFISDGKDIFFYTAADRRVEKGKLKDSADLHAPLAFLLGKLDFHKEFRTLTTRQDNEGLWIVAQPKSKSLAWSRVDFLAAPDGQIRKVRIVGQDESTLDFNFLAEQLNPAVSPALFTFVIPPGVEVVEAGQ